MCIRDSTNSNNNSEEKAKEKDKSTSSDNNGSKNNGKEEAKRVHYRRQEDVVAPKQIVAGAFELFVALSVSEAEKITMEHGGLEVFASAIKRVGVVTKASISSPKTKRRNISNTSKTAAV